MSIVLVPAYGRVYTTKEEMLQDWEAGKDFKIYGGSYTSIRDKDALLSEYYVIELVQLSHKGREFYEAIT